MNAKVVAAALLLCLVGHASAGILIKQGDSGTPVVALQHLMNYYGAGLAADGAFGPGTKAAVQSIQEQINVSPDGLFPLLLSVLIIWTVSLEARKHTAI